MLVANETFGPVLSMTEEMSIEFPTRFPKTISREERAGRTNLRDMPSPYFTPTSPLNVPLSMSDLLASAVQFHQHGDGDDFVLSCGDETTGMANGSGGSGVLSGVTGGLASGAPSTSCRARLDPLRGAAEEEEEEEAGGDGGSGGGGGGEAISILRETGLTTSPHSLAHSLTWPD